MNHRSKVRLCIYQLRSVVTWLALRSRQTVEGRHVRLQHQRRIDGLLHLRSSRAECNNGGLSTPSACGFSTVQKPGVVPQTLRGGACVFSYGKLVELLTSVPPAPRLMLMPSRLVFDSYCLFSAHTRQTMGKQCCSSQLGCTRVFA